MATGLETGRPSNRIHATIGRNVRFWPWFVSSSPSPILEAEVEVQVSLEIRAGVRVDVRSDPKSKAKAAAKVSSEPLRLSFGPAAKRC